MTISPSQQLSEIRPAKSILDSNKIAYAVGHEEQSNHFADAKMLSYPLCNQGQFANM